MCGWIVLWGEYRLGVGNLGYYVGFCNMSLENGVVLYDLWGWGVLDVWFDMGLYMGYSLLNVGIVWGECI